MHVRFLSKQIFESNERTNELNEPNERTNESFNGYARKMTSAYYFL